MASAINTLKKELLTKNNSYAIDESKIVESELDAIPLDLALEQDGTLPLNAIAHSFSRRNEVLTNATALVTQRETAVPIVLLKGTTVSNITFVSATTAGGTLTLQKFGLYDDTFNLLAETEDDTSTAWGANTAKTLDIHVDAVATPFETTYSGVYYLGILVNATTVPTLAARAVHTGAANLLGVTLEGQGGYRQSGITTATNLTDLQDPLVLSAVAAIHPYAYVS